MELRPLSADELKEWLEHPVAGIVRSLLASTLSQQETAARAAYWAGKPVPEAQRLAIQLAQGLLEDWFEASAEDFNTMMEMMNAEPERDSPR